MSSSTTPPYECYVGVDIAAKERAAALLLPAQKTTLAPGTFSQDNAGFTRFIEVLKSTGYQTEQILVVMEATGPYWVALALTLTQSGYATSVVNPAQVHYFALNGLRTTGWML
jgi:transposase